MFRNHGTVISSGLCLLAALWVLVLPVPWIAAFLSSAMCHELFHIGAIKLCGGTIYKIRFRLSGAEIETSPLSGRQEIFCAAAGPLSGFILLLLIRTFPRIALCGLFHSIYNLLPIYPMDGGRILRRILFLLLPEKSAHQFERFTEIITTAFLSLGIFWISFMVRSVFLPMVFFVMYLVNTLKTKKSCKDGTIAVQ